MEDFDEETIIKSLKRDAKALDIPPGSAEVFIERALKEAKTALKNKRIITRDDLTRAISKELKKYHPDLAYVYKNRDKII